MDFTIRNLPAFVLEDLQRAARLNGRSVSDEVIARLEGRAVHLAGFDADLRREVEARAAAALTKRPPIEQLLAEIREMREQCALPPLTQEFLDRAKSEGRP